MMSDDTLTCQSSEDMGIYLQSKFDICNFLWKIFIIQTGRFSITEDLIDFVYVYLSFECFTHTHYFNQ